MLPYLIRKEFLQFKRNSFLPKLMLMMPIMLMLVFPWAATQEVKDLRIAFVDHDRSAESRRLIEKTTASGFFVAQACCRSHAEAEAMVRRGDADMVVDINRGFARNLHRPEASQVMIAPNAVNGTKGMLGAAYLQQIIDDYTRTELHNDPNGASIMPLNVSQRFLFNPALDYKRFMVPALMTTLLTLLAGFLPALNIVSEKERGTIEQINVTPVSKAAFVLGKLIPYWVMGFAVMNFAMLIAYVTYGFSPSGSLLTVYAFAVVFIVLISGFGLLVSNFSQTMQQAMFVMFFCVLVLLLISGMFTPVSSMPDWAQIIAACNPLRYFAEAMRMIYLKSSSVTDMLPSFVTLCAMALVLNTAAVLSYRKNS
ncbi:MAG: ABC transporter permease, partial [Muribaculaceae bacterium]